MDVALSRLRAIETSREIISPLQTLNALGD